MVCSIDLQLYDDYLVHSLAPAIHSQSCSNRQNINLLACINGLAWFHSNVLISSLENFAVYGILSPNKACTFMSLLAHKQMQWRFQRCSIQGGHDSKIMFIAKPLHYKLDFSHLYTLKKGLKINVCVVKILVQQCQCICQHFIKIFHNLIFSRGCPPGPPLKSPMNK